MMCFDTGLFCSVCIYLLFLWKIISCNDETYLTDSEGAFVDDPDQNMTLADVLPWYQFMKIYNFYLCEHLLDRWSETGLAFSV